VLEEGIERDGAGKIEGIITMLIGEKRKGEKAAFQG